MGGRDHNPWVVGSSPTLGTILITLAKLFSLLPMQWIMLFAKKLLAAKQAGQQSASIGLVGISGGVGFIWLWQPRGQR